MIAHSRNIGFCLLLLGAPSSVFASSAYIGIHSVDGLGRAYAGEVAVAETASATSKNPALILSLDGVQISAGAAMVLSKFDAQVNKHPFINENEKRADMDAENFGPNYIPLPGIHMTVNRGNWGFGFSVSSYHGGLLNYDDTDFGITELGDDTYALTANVQFDFAYKLTDSLHIGAGIDYGYGKANVERAYGFVADARFLDLLSPIIDIAGYGQEIGIAILNQALPDLTSFDEPNNQLANFRGSTRAFGYHIGLNYIPTESLNIGLTYRSKMDYRFEGRYYSDLPVLPDLYTYGTGSKRHAAYADVGQPAMAEIGANFKVTPKLDVHGGIFWQQWSDLQQLKIINKDTGKKFVEKDLIHQDNLRYSVGGAYQVTPKFKVRLGFSLDQSAVAEKHASLTFPSSDRYWFSTGFNYLLDEKSSIDFAVSYAQNKNVTSREVGLIVEALDDIEDTMTVSQLLNLLRIDLSKVKFNGLSLPPLPPGVLNREVNVDELLKSGIYTDLESETAISVKMLFVGLQYNRKF